MPFDSTPYQPRRPNPLAAAYAAHAANREANARADRALKAAGGDTLKALGLVLSGKVR